jgi:hypothetical protein
MMVSCLSELAKRCVAGMELSMEAHRYSVKTRGGNMTYPFWEWLSQIRISKTGLPDDILPASTWITLALYN